jgi:hypothetical protein
MRMVLCPFLIYQHVSWNRVTPIFKGFKGIYSPVPKLHFEGIRIFYLHYFECINLSVYLS